MVGVRIGKGFTGKLKKKRDLPTKAAVTRSSHDLMTITFLKSFKSYGETSHKYKPILTIYFFFWHSAAYGLKYVTFFRYNFKTRTVAGGHDCIY
jgi:hypothetical protein